MKRFRREFPIDMVIDWGILKNNRVILFLCLTFIHETYYSGIGFTMIHH